MGKDRSSKSVSVGQRSTKPDLSHLARATDLPLCDDARSNGGCRARLDAMDDTGYPDWQGELAVEDPGDYYAVEGDDDDGDQYGDDGVEEQVDDSSEEPEPSTPPGKARRSKGRGENKTGSQTKAKAKARSSQKASLGHRFKRSLRKRNQLRMKYPYFSRCLGLRREYHYGGVRGLVGERHRGGHRLRVRRSEQLDDGEGVALQALQKRRDPMGRRIRGLIRSNGTKRRSLGTEGTSPAASPATAAREEV